MTYGVVAPYFESIALPSWKVHRFVGNASVVLDTHPDQPELFSIMVIGHADKIRLQVRSIGSDGKIWVNTDSYLAQTLIGHEVILYSRDPADRSQFRTIETGTIEALPPIHLANGDLRAGKAGVKATQVYLDLHMHGEHPKERLKELGILPGDPILMARKLRRGASVDTVYGPYLDNGLGCFLTTELATLVANHGGLDHVRLLFAVATHEEIGRLGSRMLAARFKPDVVIGVDVSHDYDATPGIADQKMSEATMGKGFALSNGAISSETLNRMIMDAAEREGIPYQVIVKGRDFGTDGMAGAFANVDAAATSIGFPIRNMHTISETAHTGDVLCAIHALFHLALDCEKAKVCRQTFIEGHPRLDYCKPLQVIPVNRAPVNTTPLESSPQDSSAT